MDRETKITLISTLMLWGLSLALTVGMFIGACYIVKWIFF